MKINRIPPEQGKDPQHVDTILEDKRPGIYVFADDSNDEFIVVWSGCLTTSYGMYAEQASTKNSLSRKNMMSLPHWLGTYIGEAIISVVDNSLQPV